MANIDLSQYGITGTKEIVYNPSYDTLFEEETRPDLEGYEKGQVSELGAVNVMTGIYTGRSPKDKFIVMDENSKDTVWWTSDEYKNDNHPASQEAWDTVKKIALDELSNKRLFVVDAFCGANKDCLLYTSYYHGAPGGYYEKIQGGFIVGHSLLTAKGIPCAGEGDLKTCLAMKICDIVNKGGSYCEIVVTDYEDGTILLGHDGPFHLAIANGKPILRGMGLYQDVYKRQVF